MKKTAVVINNIGSPDTPTPQDVGKYLKVFLMDKNIIQIPFFVRWFLVNCIIVPRRKFASAEKYQQIWTEKGSPLRVITESFVNKLQQHLGDSFLVLTAMRYSAPDMDTACKKIISEKIENIIFAPMYPQYAQATTGSAIEEWEKTLQKNHFLGTNKNINYFYDHPEFIKAQSKKIKDNLKNDAEILLSYHGLPESQILKISGCKLDQSCCSQPEQQKKCYRAQCFATSALISKEINKRVNTSFQSRLGRTEWIKPYTETTLKELGSKKSNLQVACPAFVTDCIETLEEIHIEGKEIFQHQGGQEYSVIDCLNDDPLWVDSFAKIVKEFQESR